MARHDQAKPQQHKPSHQAAETAKPEAPAARAESNAARHQAVPVQAKDVPSQPPAVAARTEAASVPAEDVSSQRPSPSQEHIAQRAYELFLSRGGDHGRHDEDWTQAERELSLGR